MRPAAGEVLHFSEGCPRAMAWVAPETAERDRALLGPGGGSRVHAIEYGWLEAMRTVRLFAYRFAASAFRPFGELAHAMVAVTPVEPLGPPEPVGDLLALHASAGIHLWALPNLWPFVDAVASGSLGFSGIRLAKAAPRPSELHA